jgi:hypothetical protein
MMCSVIGIVNNTEGPDILQLCMYCTLTTNKNRRVTLHFWMVWCSTRVEMIRGWLKSALRSIGRQKIRPRPHDHKKQVENSTCIT